MAVFLKTFCRVEIIPDRKFRHAAGKTLVLLTPIFCGALIRAGSDSRSIDNHQQRQSTDMLKKRQFSVLYSIVFGPTAMGSQLRLHRVMDVMHNLAIRHIPLSDP